MINSSNPKAWQEARELWLERLPSAHTRRAYGTSLALLEKSSGKALWEISRADINRWLAKLQKGSRSKSTLANRIVAVRSFYRFVIEEYVLLDKGVEINLRSDNPAASIRVPKVDLYGKAVCLDEEQARAILKVIDLASPAGKRDYAMILGYMLMGLRSSELRLMRYEDIEDQDGMKLLRYVCKGGREAKQEIFPPVYEAIMEYAMSEGRYSGYVFHSYDHNSRIVDRPITGQTALDALRRYARAAGIRAEGLKIHSLRHTATYLRMQAGENTEDARAFLKHTNERTTAIYRRHLRPEPDKTWMTVSEYLGAGKGHL